MLKRKKLLAALLAGTMMLSLVGCGKKADTSGDTTDTTDPSTPPAETQLTPWEEASQIYNTEETDEELYQKALDEGGTVTLYSISSRCTKVEAAFEEKYPGIDCVPFDISTNELLEKVTREYEAGPACSRRCPHQGPGRLHVERVCGQQDVLQLSAR